MTCRAVRAISFRVGIRGEPRVRRFELVFDDGEIGAGLIGLAEREAGNVHSNAWPGCGSVAWYAW